MQKIKLCTEPRYLIRLPRPISTKALKAFFEDWVGKGSVVNVKRSFCGTYHVRVTHETTWTSPVSWDMIVGNDAVAMLALYKGGSGTFLTEKQLLDLDYIPVEE